MTREEFNTVIQRVKDSGLKYKEYPNTYQVNVTDVDGTIQSYYASTGTAIFRDGNDKYNSQRHTERGMALDKFLKLCSGEEDILETYFS